MSLKLCKKEDALVKFIREELGAMMIKVPSERYQPFMVLEKKRKTKRAHIRGAFSSYLTPDSTFALQAEDLDPTLVANISGKKSVDFDLNIGLKILDGYLEAFLGGMGINVPELTLGIKSAKQMAYTFENVHEVAVDHGLLGQALDYCEVQLNAASQPYFGENASDFLMIDRIITSNNFTITTSKENETEIAAELEAVAETIGKLETDLKVTVKSSNTISFEGEKPLAFAFSVVHLILDDNGKIVEIPAVDEIKSKALDGEIFGHIDLTGEPILEDFLEDFDDLADDSL